MYSAGQLEDQLHVYLFN